MKYLFLVLFIFCLQHKAFSQKLLAGNSISFLSPSGNFGAGYDGGFGVGFNAELGIIKQLGLTGELGWSHWNGTSDHQGMSISDRDTFNLLVGGKIGFWLIYLEARTGYYFGDVKEFVIIPAAGIRIGKLDLNVGYQLTEDFNFINFRLGYFWI